MGKIGDLWVRLGLKSEDFDKGVKNAENTATRGSESIIKSWKKVAAGVTAAVAAVKAFASAFKSIAEFQQANANLATILGVSRDKMEALRESALALGRTTAYTASQVTELQTELAKLGFSQSEIMGMQKSVLNFATAVGTDLASAAALAGSTLRGFGLDTTQTEDALATLTLGTTKSALSFSYLQSAMAIVMPVAQAFGYSVKDTVAILGTLANAGFDASSAATATRNILLYLADSNSKLSKTIGKPVKSLADLSEAMQTLESKGISLASTLELTDKRAVAAFNALLQGAGDMAVLRGELDKTGGVLESIATERLDTVAGSVQLLNSAWEGFILSMSNSTGVIKGVLDALTDLVTFASSMFKGNRVSGYQDRWTQSLESYASEYGVEAAKAYGEQLYNRITSEAVDAAVARDKGGIWGRLFKNTGKNARVMGEYEEGFTKAYDAWLKSLDTTPVAGGSGYVEGSLNNDDPFAALLEALNGKKSKEKKLNTSPADRLRGELSKWSQSLAASQRADDADLASEIAVDYREIIEDITALNDAYAELSASIIQAGDAMGMDYFGGNIERYGEWLNEMVDVTNQAAEQIKDAIVDGIGESVQYLTDALFGLEELDGKQLMGALIAPLADACVTIGKAVMATGLASEAFQSSLTNPLAAVAAGAALIAVGSAAKSAISSAIGGATGAYPQTGADSSIEASSAYSGELTINVSGIVQGDNIVITGQKAMNNWNR